MSFGGMFDGAGSGVFSYDAGGGGVHNSRLLPTPPVPKPGGGFAAPGLSLGLQTMDGGQLGDVNRSLAMMGNGGSGSGGDGDSLGRGREDENDSRSGSDNLDGASGDELDPDNSNPRKKKKRYHRHTPQQIQELEAVFKECPHPDEKQRMELSRRLNLESRQVKFWFQNRRTQMKTQIERHENALLRQENDKLRAENMTIREAMRNPMCASCGGAAVLGEVSLEEQHLRIENARLKDELDRVCALAGKFLGRPISSISSPGPPSMQACSGLELGVGSNGGFGLGAFGASALQSIPDLMSGSSGLTVGPVGSAAMRLPAGIGGLDGAMHAAAADGGAIDRAVLLELALAAMDELVKVAQMDEPLWLPSLDGGFETLNYDEYHRAFARVLGQSPAGYVSEATRESGIAIISSVDLVDSLMDAPRWSEMFPCVVARASTTDIISSGMGGTRSGSIQLMHAELQVLSPLVPIREVVFLRFCKQHAEGLWAVVDVSVDAVLRSDQNGSGGGSSSSYMGCRLLPTGCIVQDMNNGYSKVTWVVHAEYEETAAHQLYRPLLRSGQALGARRWLASLQRQCQYLAILCSNSLPARDHAGELVVLVLAPVAGDQTRVCLMVLWFCSDYAGGEEEHAEAGAANDGQLLRGGVRVGSAEVAAPGRVARRGRERRRWRRGRGGQGADDGAAQRGRAGGATGRRAERHHVGAAPRHAAAARVRLPPRRAAAWRLGHPCQRRGHAGDGPHCQGPAPRQRRLPPPSKCHKREPEQHADPPGDVHRLIRLPRRLRSGGRAVDARRHERRRLRLRLPPPLRLRHPPRRPQQWRLPVPGRGRRRLAELSCRWWRRQQQHRLAGDGGVPDPRQQPADGEAHRGVRRHRQQPPLLHHPEDQVGTAGQHHLAIDSGYLTWIPTRPFLGRSDATSNV